MSGRLYCLASTESKSCNCSSATSASAICLSVGQVRELVLQTTLPVLPAITRQPGVRWFWSGQLRGEALRLHQRLVVDHEPAVLRGSLHQNSSGCTSAAVPVKGQEAPVRLLYHRIVAVYKVALKLSTRIKALRPLCTSLAKMPRRLQLWRSMALKSAQLPGHAERLVPKAADVLLAAAGSSPLSMQLTGKLWTNALGPAGLCGPSNHAHNWFRCNLQYNYKGKQQSSVRCRQQYRDFVCV